MQAMKRTSGIFAPALQARGEAVALVCALHWNSDNSPAITGAMSML
jgi:hypothetical protein